MDDNFNDYFVKDKEEEVPQPHVETPQEREDRELAEATIERRHNTLRILLVSAIILLTALLCWWFWSTFFHPYAEGQERGYIMQVTSEGSLLKTIEGKMLTQRFIEDTLALESDFRFSIRDDSVAKQAKQYEGTGQLVMVTYKIYHARLPWRGNSPTIVTTIAPDTLRIDTTHIAARRDFIP